MENELIQIARFLTWPAMRGIYSPYLEAIAQNINDPGAQLCVHVIRTSPQVPIPSDSHDYTGTSPMLDWLAEETLCLANRNVMTPNGRVQAKARDIGATLQSLRECCDRLQQYSKEERLNGEMAFRDWLQRAIMNAAFFAEPIIGAKNRGEDPVINAIGLANQLRESKPAHENGDDGLCFPLANPRIEVKPKVPTCIDPFDRFELEGGAEEDTCTIISGESNIGKSHLGLFCLSRIALLSNEPTLLASGEDSEATTKRRVFAHFLGIPDKELIKLTELEIVKAMTVKYGDPDDPKSEHYSLIHNFAMACIEEGRFHPKTIEEKMDAFEQKRQRKIRAYMADYLQKMNENPIGRKNNRQRDEELEFVVNQQKQLCQDRKAMGIIISQTPSHAAGGNFEFLNLKQAVARSYAATWGAHYVITMNRPAAETTRLSTSMDKRPRLNIALCKNKSGPLGVCYALGNPDKAHWEFFRSKQELLGRTENMPERVEFSPSAYRESQQQNQPPESLGAPSRFAAERQKL